MINFIAFVLCGAFAIKFAIEGKVGFCIFESALALINLPFTIQWMASIF